MADNFELAPEYRFFTADLLTNKILMEIPFRDVTYSLALKGAGTFGGKIPVITTTQSLDLYNTTTPGNTALYVVRDNKCVWGGIIWDRGYNIKTRDLSIDASEFTSYFYHRRIWKTWSHQYGAHVTISNGAAAVFFDFGSTSALVPGSSVKLEFYDPKDFRYNGYYKIADTPSPTTNSFYIEGARSTSDVISVERVGDTVTIQTDGNHGFSTGDIITVNLGSSSPFNGTFTIEAVGGSATDRFTYTQGGPAVRLLTTTGVATRPLPTGSFENVTVSVRADTYDYIRSLIDAVFKDFVGIDFANQYIEPGVSYKLDVINKQLEHGYATVYTQQDHALSAGQAVQVDNLGILFDGEHVVTEVPSPRSFRYRQGGNVLSTPVSVEDATIVARQASNYTATVWTATPHNFYPGQYVSLSPGADLGGQSAIFGGTVQISAVPNSTSFQYPIMSPLTIPKTSLPQASVNAASSTKIRTNLAFNPRPQNNSDGWSFSAPGVTAEFARANKNYGDIGWWQTLTFSTRPTNAANISFGSSPMEIPVTPGNTYAASVAGHLTWGGAATRAFINWVRSDGTVFTGSSGPGAFHTANTVGLRSVVATAPEDAAYMRVYFGYLMGYAEPMPGDVMSATMFTVEQANVAGPVFDGGYTNTGESTYGWKGLAFASASTVSSRVVEQIDIVRKELTSNKATLATAQSTNIKVGDLVNVQGVSHVIPIREKALDAGISRATITTTVPHQLASGDTVTINGLRDSAVVTNKVISGTTPTKTVTLTTSQNHNFAADSTVEVSGMVDRYVPFLRSVAGTVGVLTTTTSHNLVVGDLVKIDNIKESYSVSAKSLTENVATVKTRTNHSFQVNDVVTIANMNERGLIISRSAERGIATLTLATAHNFKAGEKVSVTGAGVFNFEGQILAVTGTRILYELSDKNANIAPQSSGGTVVSAASIFNGDYTIQEVTPDSFSFALIGNNQPETLIPADNFVTVTGGSPFNGEKTVTGVPSSTTFQVSVVSPTYAATVIPYPSGDDTPKPEISTSSILNGSKLIRSITPNTIVFNQDITNSQASVAVNSGVIASPSIFNGSYAITKTSDTEFTYAKAARTNVLEVAADTSSYVRADSIFNGSYTVTSIAPEKNSFSYSRTHSNIGSSEVSGYGSAEARPSAIVSSYGPYPGNSDIGVSFSTAEYSGVNISPQAYRGFELTIVGEALDTYSDSIDGFEYRIDCEYDPISSSFKRVFQLLPINFPNPPAPGEISPISRFGADKLVFEYPGNITDMDITESAEDSATRFFAIGENDLSPDAGPPFSVASADELLNGQGRRWPLLDSDEQIDIDDETVLYAYAKRYLNESRPPDTKITLSVNGSLQPEVGTYGPGQWCSLIVDDIFVKMRLASGHEPRTSVIVRKIDSIKVSVPPSTTFPETVELVLVPEWEVDKRG